jgi:hypothetical protein
MATATNVDDDLWRERGADPEPTAGDGPWRRRPMTLGHDPLKPI